MERYVLAGYSITEVSNKIEAVRILTQDEFNLIKDAIKSLGNFDKRQSLYSIFKSNSENLISFCEEGNNKLNQDTFSEEAANKTIQGINQRLMSYLSSFITFRDHWCKRLKPLDNVGEGEFNLYRLFEDRMKFHWDKNFSYRFFDQLRNYLQHRDLPVGLKVRVLPQSQQRHLSIFLGRDELLKDDKLRKKFKVGEEVKNGSELIDLIENILDFNICIEDINRVCTLIDFYSVAKDLNLLMDMYCEVKEKLPQASPCLAIVSSIPSTSEHPSEQRLKMRFCDFPKRMMIKMQEMEPSLREFAQMGAPPPQNNI
jgi:hypothetical protein